MDRVDVTYIVLPGQEVKKKEHHEHQPRAMMAKSWSIKATTCNFDCEPWLRETKLNDARSYIASNRSFSNNRSYFMEKMSSGFPSNVLRLLCLSAAFYFSRAVTNNCCSCSFRLQAGWGCQDLGDVTLYLFAWIMNAWGWDDGGLEVTVFTAAVFHKFMNYSYSVRWDVEMIMFVKFYDLVLCTLFTLNYCFHPPVLGLQAEMSSSAKTWYNASLLVLYEVNVLLCTGPK